MRGSLSDVRFLAPIKGCQPQPLTLSCLSPLLPMHQHGASCEGGGFQLFSPGALGSFLATPTPGTLAREKDPWERAHPEGDPQFGLSGSRAQQRSIGGPWWHRPLSVSHWPPNSPF